MNPFRSEQLKDYFRALIPLPLRRFVYTTQAAARQSVRSLFFSPITCRVRHVTVRLAFSSELEKFRAATYETKEPEMLDWLDHNLRDSDVFYDVGANVGLYSLYAAKISVHAAIYAFEPESQNYSRLCRNIVLNDVTNIIPCGFPLADKEHFDYLYVGELVEGGSQHSFGEINRFRSDPSKCAIKQGAFSLTLDALVDKYGLPQPSLLKIDVDGLEDKILRGASHVLRSSTLRSLIIELNQPEDAYEAPQLDWLKKSGWQQVRRSDWIYRSNGMQAQNYIFVRNARTDPLVPPI